MNLQTEVNIAAEFTKGEKSMCFALLVVNLEKMMNHRLLPWDTTTAHRGLIRKKDRRGGGPES